MIDVVVVSAGDRCFWLLDQLCKAGLKTSVWDISSDLSLSIPDREGPFGIFLPSCLDDWKKKYLCGDQFDTLSNGFCVFSSQGPLEFRGPLTSLLMQKNQDLKSCYSYLKENKKKTLMGLKKKKEINWLCNLALQLTGTYQTQRHPSPIPLFSEYILRESSFRYLQEMNHSFQEKGVSYLSGKLKSISFKEDGVDLQLQDTKVKAQFLVWALSGLETKKYFAESMDVLFPHWQEPIRIWKRYSLLWDKAAFQKVIPHGLIVVPRPEKCLHSDCNLISVKSNTLSSYTDVWVLSEFENSQNKNHLPEILNHLHILFPGFSLREKTPQDEGNNNYFVLYKTEEMRKKILSSTHPLLFHLNPESVGFSDAYSLIQSSQEVFSGIVQQRKG